MSPPMQQKESKSFAESMRSIRGKEADINRGGNADLLVGNNSFYNDTPIGVIPCLMVTPDQSPFKGRHRAESGPDIASPAQKQVFSESQIK